MGHVGKLSRFDFLTRDIPFVFLVGGLGMGAGADFFQQLKLDIL